MLVRSWNTWIQGQGDGCVPGPGLQAEGQCHARGLRCQRRKLPAAELVSFGQCGLRDTLCCPHGNGSGRITSATVRRTWRF